MKRLLAALAAVSIALGCAPPPRMVAPLRYLPVASPQELQAPPPSPAALPVVEASDPLPTDDTLPNGLRIVVVERHDFPVVATVLSVDRGGADLEDPGSRTVSETMYLFSRGGDETAYERTRTELLKLGAAWFAGLSSDVIWAGVKSAPSRLDRSIAILAERCVRAKLSRAERDHRAGELAETARMRNVNIIAAEESVLFGDKSPYGYVPPGPAPPSLERAQATHDRLFQPTQATLVVVGDVTKEQVMASATHWLGAWEAREPLPMLKRPVPPQNGPRVVAIPHYGLMQMHGAVFSRGPDPTSLDLAPFVLGAQVIGGASSSQLFSELREEGAAYIVETQTLETRAATWMTIHVSYDRDHAVKGTADVLAAIERLRAGKVTDDEILRAREVLLAGWRDSMATVDGAAVEYTTAFGRGFTAATVGDYPARVTKVNREDLVRVANEYLAAKSLHVLFMGEERWLDVSPLGMGSAVTLSLR